MTAPTTVQPTPNIALPKKASVLNTLFNHPLGFWFIFWGELAERCSFYGMMAILPRFISEPKGLDLGDANSNTWVSMFKAGAYFLPLVGGFLADQYFGKYRLIVMFSLPYILGHVLMYPETIFWTLVALSLLAMGSGIIKPNISTLMGMTYDQKRPGDEGLRSMAFGLFYMAINIGAAFSYAFLPVIRDNYGYGIAFLCPAVLMAISFLIFAVGKPFYAVEVITPRKGTPEERAVKWLTLRRVAGLFLVITFFWAVFDQSHTIWVFFARDFTDLRVFGMEIAPDQIGTLNPVLIVVFVPLMPFLWTFVENRGFRVRPTDKILMGFVLTMLSMGILAIAAYQCGPYEDKDSKRIVQATYEIDVQPTMISSCLQCHGQTSTAGGFDLSTLAGVGKAVKAKDADHSPLVMAHKKLTDKKGDDWPSEGQIKTMRRWIDEGAASTVTRPVSLWWIVLAFVTLTLAEVLISITGLELAFVVAPPNMKSFVTALWLMTVTIANFFINAPVGRLYTVMSPGDYHLMLTGAMVAIIVVFYFVALRFNQMAVEQEAAMKAASLPTDSSPAAISLRLPPIGDGKQKPPPLGGSDTEEGLSESV